MWLMRTELDKYILWGDEKW